MNSDAGSLLLGNSDSGATGWTVLWLQVGSNDSIPGYSDATNSASLVLSVVCACRGFSFTEKNHGQIKHFVCACSLLTPIQFMLERTLQVMYKHSQNWRLQMHHIHATLCAAYIVAPLHWSRHIFCIQEFILKRSENCLHRLQMHLPANKETTDLSSYA
jgi:hypothetical protein